MLTGAAENYRWGILDMMGRIIFTAAFLAAGLAYGANPSAVLPVQVGPAITAPSVTATPSSIPAGGTETVTVANSDGGRLDWVGLYPVGGSNTNAAILWEYLNGTNGLPPADVTSATLSFVLPPISARGRTNSVFSSITAARPRRRRTTGWRRLATPSQ
jgi:hypothetical protein